MIKNLTQFPKDSTIPNKSLRVKFGIDPTTDELHLGHLIPLRAVKHFKDNGHSIDIVLGTFTASLGDPSGRNEMRPMLSIEQCEHNAWSIQKQVERILGVGQNVSFHWNGKWFKQMNSIQMIEMLSKFTVSQALSRDSFQDRISVGTPVGMEPEICLLTPIINGTDGRKMSKSFSNCIFLKDEPNDVFGKVMSISDEVMHEWLPLLIHRLIS